MEKQQFSRRDFIKTSAAGTAGLMVGCRSSGSDLPYNAHGLPTMVLGKTGVTLPRIAIGCGSRWCSIESEKEALDMITYALDNGMYYWDTAHQYENKKLGFASEERLGKVLKTRRKEVFLATKVDAREPDEAKKMIEDSLNRLQTDHVDLLQIHSIQSMEDVDKLGKKGDVVDVVRQMKEEGITRFIGFTGHTSAEAMKAMAERYELDNMLIALNHHQEGKQAFEEQAVPAARKNGLGVMVMKTIRPREQVKTLSIKDLVRYALSLKQADGAVIGMDSLEVVKANIALLKDFKPMTEPEMEQMQVALAPFYNNPGIQWMQPGYKDGLLA